MSVACPPEEFFAAVWGGGLHSISVRSAGTEDFETFGAFAGCELFEWALSFEQRADVWVGALVLHEAPDPGRRGKKADLATELRWMFADLDWRHRAAHADADTLPTEAAVRAMVESFVPMPTFVVATGHGLQLWWQLDRPLDHDEWDATAKRLKSMLTAAGHPKVERTTDRASVLRPPGSWNVKKGCEPVEVFVSEATGTVHAPEVFVQCGSEPKQERTRKERTRSTSSSTFRDGETPADWVRRDGDGRAFAEVLEEYDFIIGDDLGDDGVDVTRPGKDGGTSGRLHTGPDGGQYLNLFSPNGPPRLYEVGTPGDGDPVERTLTKWDVIVALEFDGDASAAGREIRRQMRGEPAASGGTTPNDDDDEPVTLVLIDWAAEPPAIGVHIADGYIIPGRWTATMAPKKQGKSSVLLWATVEVSEGRDPWTGAERPPVTVLWVDAENGRDDIEEKIADFGHDPLALKRFHASERPVKLDTPAGAAVLLATVDKVGAEVVVLDGLNGHVAGEENDTTPWRDLFDLVIRPLKVRGVAVATADNMGKTANKGARGSSTKGDKADAEFQVTKREGGAIVTQIVARSSAFAASITLAAEVMEGGGIASFRRTDGPPPDPEGTTEVVALLDRLNVPTTIGRPTVKRDWLSKIGDEGKVRHAPLAAAIRRRKERDLGVWVATK